MPLGLPILSFSELRQKNIPERKKLLPWLSESGLVMIYAPAGCGKTYFTQSLTISLLSGASFLAWKVIAPVSVLYIDGEMAQNDFRDRWLTLMSDPAIGDKLYTLSHEDFFEQEETDLNLANEIQQSRLKATIEKHPEIKVVIFDNLSCLFPTLREDKRDDWVRDALPLLIWLRRRGIAAVLLHHTGKGGDQRGTVARMDALNTAINLKPIEGVETTGKAAFELHFKKSRDCHGATIRPLSCKLNKNDDGFLVWTYECLEESAESRLLSLIDENGGEMSGSDAAAAMGVTASRISHLKSDLIRDGKLQKAKALKFAEKVDSYVDR